ncbi:MAG: CxxxxCH/CxxCH domain-containing protein, partial [Nitrospirota bacterium]
MKIHKLHAKKFPVFLLLISFILVTSVFAAPPPPTVSIINPKPGTSSSPTIVSLRPTTNDFKVQVKVWNDVAISANTVQIGYYSGATPDTGTFTWTTATLNSDYPNAANYGVYEAWLNLTAGNDYYLMARASEDGGVTYGYSRDNRTGNDARYVYVSIKAANSGTGMLLVRDSSTQLCLDCHNLATHSSETTDTGYGNWQIVCLECHQPHGTKNIFLVKETITTPNSGNQGVTFYNTTGDAANSYVLSGAGNGICEVCHTQTRNPTTSADRWRNTGNADNHYDSASGTARCTDCHVHVQGFKGSCDSCHNSPPSTGKHSTHFGTGTVNYGTTSIQSTTGAYGFSCGICHYGTHLNTLPNNYPTPHTVEVVFAGVATQDGASGAAYAPAANSVDDPGRGWSFNYSDGTCSNIYCHGNYPGSGKNASVNHETGTAVCGSCHEATNTTTPASGSHSIHAYVKDYSCTLCHNGTVGGTGPASYTVADKSKHVNGFVDWKFDTTNYSWLAGASYSISSGTAVPSDGSTPRLYGICNNLYCHSDAQPNGGVGAPDIYMTPTWGSSLGTCGYCHDVSTSGSFGHTSSVGLASGSHTSHLAYDFTTGNNTIKCAICHKLDPPSAFKNCNACHAAYQKHVDHQIDVSIEQFFGNTAIYNGSPDPGNGYSNCSNTYCHSNGTSVSSGTIPNNTSANWGSGVLACNACHGNATYADYRRAGPLYTDGTPKKNVHQLHLRANGSVLTDPSCAMCHYSVTTTNTTIADKTLHVNKTYNVNASGAGIQYFSWA